MNKNSHKLSGGRVRQVRKELDKSQDEFAELLGLSDGKYISKIECGGRALPAHHAQAICDLAVKPTSYKWLMGETDYRSDSEAILHDLALDMVNQKKVREAVSDLAEQAGYCIIPPDMKTLSTLKDFENSGFFVKKGNRVIRLSSDEMEALEELVLGNIKLQIGLLFRTKPSYDISESE